MTTYNDSRAAYLSMEIALDPAMPTYSGGLGILAGDTLLSAADLGVRMAAVTLLHRKGYFRQHVDEHGNQFEELGAAGCRSTWTMHGSAMRNGSRQQEPA